MKVKNSYFHGYDTKGKIHIRVINLLFEVFAKPIRQFVAAFLTSNYLTWQNNGLRIIGN